MMSPAELSVQKLEDVVRRLATSLQTSQNVCANLRARNKRLREIVFVLALYAGAGTVGAIVGALR